MKKTALILMPLIFLGLFFAAKHEEISPEIPREKLHVCTVASFECQGLNQLLESAGVRHITVDTLGLNQSYRGHGQKLRCVQEYVKNIPNSDVVMFVDAFDALILSDEKDILEKFHAMNVPFVIATEVNCFPFPHLAAYFPESPTRFRYINSGSYIGYAWYIKKLLAELSPIPEETDDQGLLAVYLLYHPGAFKLDYQGNLFLTLNHVAQDELELDKKAKNVRCLFTNETPCVIHGTAQGKELYQHVYNKLFTSKGS